MTAARLDLSGVTRLYRSGEETIVALRDIDLVVEPGEMVAIVGASGSGKSTLMNILGCLDRPSAGTYRINGVDASTLDPDALARLRREHFGFVFQRYHLINTLTAAGNVELPGIYAGLPAERRREGARQLLIRLGLGDRLAHRPNQLSGGQQQRVAIARALMNGGGIVLADEPTGALDSRSGQAVLAHLKEMHAEGRTVIIVTHNHDVAAHAGRIIEIADGRIVADSKGGSGEIAARPEPDASQAVFKPLAAFGSGIANAFSMSFRSMAAQKLRTALTMLGIVIGITAVVAVIGLGEGARIQVMTELSRLGTNALSIYSGSGLGNPNSARTATLTVEDADALAAQPFIDSASPEIRTSLEVRYGAATASLQVFGVGPMYFRTSGFTLTAGRILTSADVDGLYPNAVLSQITATELFKGADPIGCVITIDKAPATVVGVVSSKSAPEASLVAYLSHTALRARFVGNMAFGSIELRIKDGIDTGAAERAVDAFLTRRHGTKDFFILNFDELRRSAERTMAIFSLLIAALAAVALVVGGIGVMNIMLISVTERTREIGLRMAIGARRADIMTQFMIEAVAVCLVGAGIGILVAVGISAATDAMGLALPIVLTWQAVLLGSASAMIIGLVFGYLPARNAALLDPVDALSRE